MFRVIFPIVLLLIFFSSSLISHAAHETNIGTEVGRYAPSIDLHDLAGSAISLESLRGSVVLLSFWSTNCTSCMAKMPSLNRLHDAFKEKDFQVISVAVDQKDQPVRDYVLKNNIAFAVLLDKDKEVFLDRYDSPGLPATYLIDQDGVIVEKFNGLAVWDAPDMKSRVLMLLNRN